MTRTRSFDLMADFHQFVVHDSNGDWSGLPDRWTEETVEAMFVQGEGYIADVVDMIAELQPVLGGRDAHACLNR
jgi:hypothetical protein